VFFFFFCFLFSIANFAPVIKKAIEIVKEAKTLHILIIIADGLVNKEQETSDAIVAASKYPLSIVVVGTLSFILFPLP
jgi:E3 ubiquitin-protein ligase RGLG